MKCTTGTLITLAFIAGFLALPAAAEWSHDPLVNTPVCTDLENQDRSTSVSDGAGGVIITWRDHRHGTETRIYAQRLDADGNPQWTADGVPVSSSDGPQDRPLIVSDDAGGAIVAFTDYRWLNGDVRAQRVSPQGVLLWDAEGVMICVDPNRQSRIALTSDGAGGAIVAWQDDRLGESGCDIYAQRINSSGQVQWTPDGEVVCAAADNQSCPELVGDGDGGAIIAWDDERAGELNRNVYAQRVDSEGTMLWTADGVVVCDAAENQMWPQVISDGFGGVIVAWDDDRWWNRDIFAQRLDAEGTALWNTNGLMVCVESENQMWPQVISDTAGGAYISWNDFRSVTSSHVYIQRISGAGLVQWTPNGVQVHTQAEPQANSTMLEDGTGGAIIFWMDYQSSGRVHLYTQKFDADASPQWPAAGIAVATAPSSANQACLVSDGAGGIIASWCDFRPLDQTDIYAQQVDVNGLLGGPTPPQSMVGASLTCSPGAGTVPFTSWMTLSLGNLNTSFTRRVAGHIDIHLASGTGFFPNWRAGFTNIDPGGSYDASWPVNIPALGTMIGANRFELHAMDVTPPPYNIFPFPPSGTTDSDTCVVYGIAP